MKILHASDYWYVCINLCLVFFVVGHTLFTMKILSAKLYWKLQTSLGKDSNNEPKANILFSNTFRAKNEKET